MAMGAAIVVLFLLPWLDRSEVKSIRYRGGIYKKALLLFVISFFALGYLGMKPPTPTLTILARVFTVIYFGFFLLMPIYTRWEKFKPVPKKLTTNHSMEDCIPELIKTFDEMTVKDPIKTKSGKVIIPRKPSPSGILNVAKRTVKNLKDSLD